MTRAIFSSNCWFEGKLQPATVVYSNGVITAVHRGKKDSEENFTETGDDVLMPGVIDAHVHVNEPGRTEWEGFDTATMAAAAGGITTIVDMPLNASPVTTSVSAFEKKLEATKGKLHVNCGFYGGIVPGNANELNGLIEKGVLGIKAFLTHSGIDEFPNVDKQDLSEGLQLMANRVPLLAHCELSDDDHWQLLHSHPKSYQAYLASRPRKWENDAVKMMIELCEAYGSAVHVVHVSSADALTLIKDAKAKGLLLTAETCPHYIFFDAEDIPDGNTLYKAAPPIREKTNNDKLKAALGNGVLDLLGSDHSPAPPSIKELESGDLEKAWGGIAGLQFLLNASWTALKKSMSLEAFIPLLTEAPAKMLRIADRKGKIAVGYDADLVVWSPEESAVIINEDILYKHKISPYVSRPLFGKIKQTIVNGETVFQEDKIIQKNKGKWVLRK
jgi:allantoinase